MKQEVSQLEPLEVWKHFAALNAVPRPSKKEEKVIAFMENFGQNLGLETIVDKVGNVIIRKNATAGMESRKTVVLQSHLDMVHQKNNDTVFDFEKEGIKMYVDGDWVRARGTTLGADNGMGVAAIMALLEADNIPHPAIEALFTIDEETGMTGAKGLQPNLLQGEILLNLDTEEDDEIDIGCAGGIDITASGTYKVEQLPKEAKGYQVIVNGLQGGHSGMDIHKGFGNANKIMNRVLMAMSQAGELRIVSINGGGLRNAIPRESIATLAILSEEEEILKKLKILSDEILKEYQITEPNLKIRVKPHQISAAGMSQADQSKLLYAIAGIHNGVFAMSPAIPDLVQTSNNVARVEVGEGQISIGCLTRSSVESSKTEMANSLSSVLQLAGYKVTLSGEYPGWNPNPDSKILTVLKDQYEKLFQHSPEVIACHAGLECGIIGSHYPKMDMISFGPTIKGAHSPDERVSISSVQKFWKFLKTILVNIPEE